MAASAPSPCVNWDTRNLQEEWRKFKQNADLMFTGPLSKATEANGLAEKTVQSVKTILEKAERGRCNAFLSILEFRNTPVDDLASPAELLMGRSLRSVFPTSRNHLQPKHVDPGTVMARRRKCQINQKKYYDRSSRSLPPLSPGDHVYVQLSRGDSWKPAVITAIGKTPRTYHIKTQQGGVFLRNRRFLMKLSSPASSLPSQVQGSSEPFSENPVDHSESQLNESFEQGPVDRAQSGEYVSKHGRCVPCPQRLSYGEGFEQFS